MKSKRFCDGHTLFTSPAWTDHKWTFTAMKSRNEIKTQSLPQQCSSIERVAAPIHKWLELIKPLHVRCLIVSLVLRGSAFCAEWLDLSSRIRLHYITNEVIKCDVGQIISGIIMCGWCTPNENTPEVQHRPRGCEFFSEILQHLNGLLTSLKIKIKMISTH